MNRSFARVCALLLTGLLLSCGGGGGGNSTPPPDTTSPPPPPPPPPSAPSSGRIEETGSTVSFSGTWTPSDSNAGWSGGAAVQSATAGAAVSVIFSGTSIRWIGSRGRGMGIASVSVDGGPTRDVDLYAHPNDEVHTPVVTLYGLANSQHTLTIQVTGRKNNEALGNTVVIDAFDVQPGFTVSHWQDTNPGLAFSGGWTKSSQNFPWSGSGVSNLPELPVTAQETTNAGATLTVPFRGTGISWIGYRGPDAGIATVQIDGGGASEVDMFNATAKFQPIVFTATGLSDANHTLVITATGRKNAGATAARVVVDALDVITPGRRFEEYESSIRYVGVWTPNNEARVWSEGAAATSNLPGTSATFTFTGTSVTWIGCRKGSAGGTATVTLDGTLVKTINLSENYPIEGYQVPVFRAEGLANTTHTIVIEVISNTGAYVVVDAFDVV